MDVNETVDAADDISTDYQLASGFVFSGEVSPSSDVDWVEVFLFRGESYAISATGQGPNALIDPAVAIFDERGQRLGADDNGGPGLTPFLSYTAATTGLHYIAAETRIDAPGGYGLSFDFRGREIIDAPNSSATPFDIGLGEVFSGEIGAAGDRDRVETRLVAGQSYRISVEDFDAALDPYLRLYDGSGRLIAQADDGGQGDDALLLFTATTGGTYYLEMADSADTATGAYRLTVGNDLNEADDAPADNGTPYRISEDQIFRGDLVTADGAGGDLDRVAIRMSAGETYNLSLYGDDRVGELFDPVLRVYDASGAQVAFNDDAGAGTRNSQIEYTPTTTGFYYLEAGAFGNDADGRYEIAVTRGPNQPGAGDDTLVGNAGADTVRLLSGNDRFDGRAGNDVIDGGPGNDRLTGGAGADRIDGGTGIDLVDFSAAVGRVFADLAIDQRGAGFLRFYDEGQAEGDVYAGLENATGGDFADNLRGDAGENVLSGGGVSDRLYGRAGDDTLDGGTGADALYGNAGADVMTGGPDVGRSDRFIYFDITESGVGAGNRDIITDFVSGEDRIELGRLDADTTRALNQDFAFVGTAAFSGRAGELRYAQSGGDTIVQADVNGDASADFEIELDGALNLTAGDFLL